MLQCSKDRGERCDFSKYFCGSLQSSQKGEIKDLIGDRLDTMLKVAKSLSDKGFKTIWNSQESSYKT
jgi:hypothetical protein